MKYPLTPQTAKGKEETLVHPDLKDSKETQDKEDLKVRNHSFSLAAQDV